MKKSLFPLASLALTHFLVDYCCTALLTAAVFTHGSSASPLLWAVLYNGLAFAGQLPLGALADLFSLSRQMATLGCLLAAFGSVFLSRPILLCLMLGLGNACFHVGGGREALKLGRGKAAPVGKFVAPGAVGIFLGPLSAKIPMLYAIAAPSALLLCAAFHLLRRRDGRAAERLSPSPAGVTVPRSVLSALCMFLTVFLRSFMGTVTHYDVPWLPAFSLLFTLCIFGGKFSGGILADRFGSFRFTLVAQLTGTVLFVLSVSYPILSLPAIFLFNTTMAVTAATLYRVYPAMGGAMFGLTTFALYLGVLPSLFRWETPLFTPWGLGLLGLISTGLLLTGLYLAHGGNSNARFPSALSAPVSDPDSGS